MTAMGPDERSAIIVYEFDERILTCLPGVRVHPSQNISNSEPCKKMNTTDALGLSSFNFSINMTDYTAFTLTNVPSAVTSTVHKLFWKEDVFC